MLREFGLWTTVAQSGYRLAAPDEVSLPAQMSGKHPAPEWLVENRPQTTAGAPGRGAVSTQRPDLDMPVLYRSFAAIPAGDVAKVLEFAGKWGFLSRGRAFTGTAAESTGGANLYAESLEFWRAEIGKLAHAIRVHEAIQAGDTAFLAPLARFTPVDRVSPSYAHAAFWEFRSHVPASDAGEGFLSRFFSSPDSVQCELDQYTHWARVDGPANEYDDPRAVAATWLDQQITSELKTLAGAVAFETDTRSGQRGLRVTPVDLCSLFWFQFARSLSNGTDERECRECGRWFALVPKDRGRKFFCSEICKTRNFRKRKKQATDLYASGERSVDIIATATCSDADTVRKWLGIKTKGSRASAKGK